MTDTLDDRADLRCEIETAINRHSAENGSNTPDFILAQYLMDCLTAWDRAVQARERWYSRPIEGVAISQPPENNAMSAPSPYGPVPG